MAGPHGLMECSARAGRRGGIPYLRFQTWVERRSRFVTLHRAICETFHGPAPFEGAHARHLNGNSMDNRAANLAWGTAKQNAEDRDRHRQEALRAAAQ